jgi:hypothetical protein
MHGRKRVGALLSQAYLCTNRLTVSLGRTPASTACTRQDAGGSSRRRGAYSSATSLPIHSSFLLLVELADHFSQLALIVRNPVHSCSVTEVQLGSHDAPEYF